MPPERAIGPGKRRRLSRLCDPKGRFAVIAIDQRTSLERMLPTDAVDATAAMRLVKRVLTDVVAPTATAVLTDPEIGYPDCLDVLPKDVGLILAVEVSGYTSSNGHERRSRLLDGFSAADAARAGADAVKLLIYHHPEVSEETTAHQKDLVRHVGSDCAAAGLPFVLEIVTYGLGVDRTSEAFIRRKAEYVVDGVRTYSAPAYQVDVFKVQFPGDLKHTEEYRDRPFAREPVLFDEADLRDTCRRLDEAASAPWVILSAGVQSEEFVRNLRIASECGASGFLCGRAVWKDVVGHLPDETAMRRLMTEEGVRRFAAMREAVEDAMPWFQHRRFVEPGPST